MKDEIKVTLKTTLNPNMVCEMKNLQAFDNQDVNTIAEQAVQEKVTKEKSFFFI